MTDLHLQPFVLGGNTFGWTSDRKQSFAVLDAFADRGGVCIDTADQYSEWVDGNSGGESETIIGEWLAGRKNRDRVQIATKVANLSTRKGLQPANIRAAVEDSLRRLQTDHLDLYYAHGDDTGVPQEDYMSVFDGLVQEGKVREIGASNFTPERLRSAQEIAADNNLTGFTVSQDLYNLVERDVEDTHLGVLAELGIVEVPFFSLASGFLTGKYRPTVRVDSARSDWVRHYVENERNQRLLAVLDNIAAAHRVEVAGIALAWLRQRPQVAAPLASARTVEQLDPLFASAEVELTDEEMDALSNP